MKPMRIQALYSVATLARAAGVDRRRMRRFLEASGLEFIRIDAAYYVTITDLEAKVRRLWDAIQSAEGMKRYLE